MNNSNLTKWIVIELALVGVAILVAVVVGVSIWRAPSKPTVTITTPPNGITVTQGQDVTVQATASDAQGIARIELEIDAVIARADDFKTLPKKMDYTQTWQATTAGVHQLTVRAFNANGIGSDPANITLSVQPGATPAPVSSPARTAMPTALPSGTAAPCVNAALFTGEQLVADGALLQPNQTFRQTWRILNTGTCPWDARYLFIVVGGEPMSAPNSMSVANTPPNAIADMTLNFTAPASPGPHVGQWRMRAPDGSLFGSLVDARINVANPQPTPVCAGNPTIGSFTASASTIAPHSLVTLQWSGIANASSMRIDPGIGAIAPSGSLNIVVDDPTTFALTAYCGAIATSRQVSVNVVQPTPTFLASHASANVNPDNYIGACPGRFDLIGNVTTTAAGTVTYRWNLSNGILPSNIMSFYAPAAGTFTLPNYTTVLNTRGVIWAQLLVSVPNDVKSNQVNFVNTCAEPTQPPAPTRPPTPSLTPLPQRRNVTGTWNADPYSLELAEALGCGGSVCNVSGTLIESMGVTTPVIDEVSGTINVYSGELTLTILRPGAQGGFKGTVNAPSTSMSGTLNGNPITLYKQ